MNEQVFSLNKMKAGGRMLVIDGDLVQTGGKLVEKEMGLSSLDFS